MNNPITTKIKPSIPKGPDKLIELATASTPSGSNLGTPKKCTRANSPANTPAIRWT